ncbi:DnaJ-like subfamily C member 1 [Acipenser ruthenus]|uniref:DnaJ-like subfamily C member 1 n=1 Tax=Acipenser ruthenus TaxID=7906 RepID=A0A444U9S0_ACIRT|nr:DnaJ-like subfamily C member 1 [Acipenser ruthenus]
MAFTGPPFLAVLLIFITNPLPSFTWDTDLELFDLVEEIQQNFYEFLAVAQEKMMSKYKCELPVNNNNKTHFARLGYNDILVNGLPDWRQPVFYYRRVRMMSNAELGLLLFIILTVGHYAVIWSIYLEKQLDVKQYYEDYKELKIKEKEAAQAQAEQEAIQKEKRPKVKKGKSEFPVYTAYSGDNAFTPSYDQGSTIEDIEEQINDWLEDKSRSQKKKALEWTEEDLSQLTRSMVKFPGGTPGRWEKIAHDLGRSVADVTCLS